MYTLMGIRDAIEPFQGTSLEAASFGSWLLGKLRGDNSYLIVNADVHVVFGMP